MHSSVVVGKSRTREREKYRPRNSSAEVLQKVYTARALARRLRSYISLSRTLRDRLTSACIPRRCEVIVTGLGHDRDLIGTETACINRPDNPSVAREAGSWQLRTEGERGGRFTSFSLRFARRCHCGAIYKFMWGDSESGVRVKRVGFWTLIFNLLPASPPPLPFPPNVWIVACERVARPACTSTLSARSEH